ncbi:MAG: transglutaminase domain-containing protein [Fibrobacteres bacterium]|nr:transglutaminase domain-containing protein [Fibrobacterota bacterium]
MSRTLLASAVLSLSSFAFSENSVDTVSLDATALYNSFRLENMVIAGAVPYLTIDMTNRATPPQAVIETDVIDPIDTENQSVKQVTQFDKITLTLDGTHPDGSAIELWTRTGSSFFSKKGWTEWEKASSLKSTLSSLGKNRYLQVRMVLTATDKTKLPKINGLLIIAEKVKIEPFSKSFSKIDIKNERLVVSPIKYEWEKPDQADVAKFIAKTKYASVFKKRGTEMEKLIALNTAIAKTPNYEHDGWSDNYPWSVFELGRFTKKGYEIKGHCMSYAALLATVLTGLNRYPRHWAISGFRDRDHEIVDVWVDSLRKWVYLDPSLSTYYQNPETKEPLSVIEMHNIFVKTFLKRGESTASMTVKEQKDRVKSMGGGKTAPIICVDSGWHYGAKNPGYDWGWETGYMTTCFIRVTTRNNFYSKKEPWFRHFGGGINHNTFLHYVDDHNSPPRSDTITSYSRRLRDFYPSMNQAAFKASRTGEKSIELEFGNTQPFFKKYLLKIDGKPVPKFTGSSFTWNLKSGVKNTMEVAPEDAYGKQGIPSMLIIVP